MEKLNPYEGWKILSVYFYPDRQTDIYRYYYYLRNGKQIKNITRAKYLKEIDIGRLLTTDELVHHKNEITTDDRLENLEIKLRSQHAEHHAREFIKPLDNLNLFCPECHKPFTLPPKQQDKDSSFVKRGIMCIHYCSRSCAAKTQHKQGRFKKGEGRKISRQFDYIDSFLEL